MSEKKSINFTVVPHEEKEEELVLVHEDGLRRRDGISKRG